MPIPAIVGVLAAIGAGASASASGNDANRVDSLVNAMAAFTEPQDGLGDLSIANRATVTAAWQQARAWQQAGVSLA